MTTYQEFETALNAGTGCARLFELHAQLPLQDQEHARVLLQRVGCYTPESRRTDSPRDRERYAVEDYLEAYRQASEDKQRLGAGGDPESNQQAAGRYAQQFSGTAMHAAYVAALDVLEGRPPRH